MSITGEIILHSDDLYKLSIIRDGHVGVIIQLTSFLRKKYPNHKNELEEHRTQVVELSERVSVRIPTGELNKDFKKQVAEAVKKCQAHLTLLQQNNQYIEGALKDYAVSVSK